MVQELIEGTEVYLKSDPGNIGKATGRKRLVDNNVRYRVNFSSGPRWCHDYEIERVTKDEDVYDLLEKNKYGRVKDLQRSLTNIQLSGKLADVVYSMGATNTEFFAYQYKPVLAMLESPSQGLLIADEVGLGKTIEAGLIWTELRARFDAKRLVILCPAMLREKWKDELKQRFGVKAKIVNAREMRKELASPRSHVSQTDALIGSLQGLRPSRDWGAETTTDERNLLAHFLDENSEEEPLIDLLVIDEAHYLRNPSSMTTKLGELFRGVSSYVSLLSATPINLRNRDLFTLLNLIDPSSFSDEQIFPDVIRANEPLHRARNLVLNNKATALDVYKELALAAEYYLLRSNQQLQNLLNINGLNLQMKDVKTRIKLANRIEKINPLSNVVTRTRKRDVHINRVIREAHPEFVEMTAIERELYDLVEDTIEEYARIHEVSSGFLLASPQRQVASSAFAAVRHWNRDSDNASFDKEFVYASFGGEQEIDDSKPLVSFLRERVSLRIDTDELRQNDSKYDRLAEVLKDFLEKYPDEKIILFSYFRETLAYLNERLQADGVESTILRGGEKLSKQQVIDQFRDNNSQVLLCSEVASEGVDLQFCRLIINYDLPWNPMRVEQRVGRLDRIGQKADKISIWNLGYASTIDERIYYRLFERLQVFQNALGGMEAFLGEETGKLTLSLLSGKLTETEKQQQIDQTAIAIENKKLEEERLEEEAASLIAHGGRILGQINEAREFQRRILSQDLLVYVRDYLERFHQGFTLNPVGDEDYLFMLRLPSGLCAELDDFINKEKLFGQTSLIRGNEVRCRFVNNVSVTENNTEIVSQFHPIVKYINFDLKRRKETGYKLISAKLMLDKNNAILPSGDYVFAIHKWIFGGFRTEERIVSTVVSLYEDEQMAVVPNEDAVRIIDKVRIEAVDWETPYLDYPSEIIGSRIDFAESILSDEYNNAKENWEIENLDRVAFQKETATNHKNRSLKVQQDVLQRHLASNNQKMVPAVRGKIKKIEQRFDLEIEKIQLKEKATSNYAEVCYGVLRIKTG